MDLQFQKIEQFIILVNNTKGKGLESLISHLLSDQDLYSFSQFLTHDHIKELNSSNNPSKPSFDLLRIFSYGNVKEYLENASKLPVLTENQMKKLRKLTILDMASKNKSLFYEDLYNELTLKNESDLEELIIEMIYQDLLVCKIDQRNREIKVSSCKGRDIKPGEINEIKSNLKKILLKTSHIEDVLVSKIDYMNREKIKHLEHQKVIEQEENAIRNNFQALLAASNRELHEGRLGKNNNILDHLKKSDARK